MKSVPRSRIAVGTSAWIEVPAISTVTRRRTPAPSGTMSEVGCPVSVRMNAGTRTSRSPCGASRFRLAAWTGSVHHSGRNRSVPSALAAQAPCDAQPRCAVDFRGDQAGRQNARGALLRRARREVAVQRPPLPRRTRLLPDRAVGSPPSDTPCMAGWAAVVSRGVEGMRRSASRKHCQRRRPGPVRQCPARAGLAGSGDGGQDRLAGGSPRQPTVRAPVSAIRAARRPSATRSAGRSCVSPRKCPTSAGTLPARYR